MKKALGFRLWALGAVLGLLACAATEAGMVTSNSPIIERFADGVPADASRILVGLYTDAAQRIQEAVVHPTGSTFRAQEFTRGRAAMLNRQIDGVLRDVKGQTARWLDVNVANSYRKGLASALQQLRDAGVRQQNIPVRGDFSSLDRRAVAVIAADMAVDLDRGLSRLAKSAQRYLTAASQRIVPDSELSKVIAQGVISGDVRGTVKTMRGLLNAGAIEDYRRAGQQRIQVGAVEMTVARYAEMLVRTRTREATVQARHERLLANGCELVEIVGAVSENFCSEYLGRVFSITGGHRRYPSLDELPGGGPPFHPNCSKSTRAFIEDFATDEQRAHADVADKRMLTTDAGAAQQAFSAKGGADLVARRYHTTVD